MEEYSSTDLKVLSTPECYSMAMDLYEAMYHEKGPATRDVYPMSHPSHFRSGPQLFPWRYRITVQG